MKKADTNKSNIKKTNSMPKKEPRIYQQTTSKMYEEMPLFAILPKRLQVNDEIAVKGKTKSDATEFSCNLTIDNDMMPTAIAYHFNVRFDRGVIVGNSKRQCMWDEEEIIDNDFIDGPGEDFSLIFAIKDEEIIVYSEEDNTRNYICKFRHRLDYENISTFQVWGGVEKIKELTFRYH